MNTLSNRTSSSSHAFHAKAQYTSTLSPIAHSWVELSAAAFTNNIIQCKSLIGSAALAIVVKANAYGHGLFEIARLAQLHPLVDWLCVFSLSEALALRSAGITKPILTLGYIDTDPVHALNQHIHCMVDTIADVERLHHIATMHNSTFPVHIKIDSGLSRFGIQQTELMPFIAHCAQLSGITVSGILTQLSHAQHHDASVSLQQLAAFNAVINALPQKPPYIHATNTAGTLRYNRSLYSLFRIGIAAYGYYSSQAVYDAVKRQVPTFTLYPVLTWKTRIISLKSVPSGTPISYNSTYHTQRDSLIAIIPVGYSDGYDIRFSNVATVLVRGHKAPVVGRIAMNVTMIDVTDIPYACINDTVTLFGDDAWMIDALLPYTATDNVRALLTSIGGHIPRIVV